MRSVRPLPIVLAMLALAPPATASGNVFDIPAAAPPQFRAALRERLHTPAQRSGFLLVLHLEAKRGYQISVLGHDNVVAVEVTGPASSPMPTQRLFGPGRATSAYVARGTVTRRHIKASFDGLGAVDMRLRPSGRVRTSRRGHHCRGPDHFTRQLGVFVGSIRFQGERHYVAVRAHRAKGWVRTPLALRCSLRPLPPSGRAWSRPVGSHVEPRWRELTATRYMATEATRLYVLAGVRRTLFAVLAESNNGRMAVIRYALAVGRSKLFSLDEALTSAAVRPPKPFHGRGLYRAAPDGSVTWGGSLSVSLPGVPRLPLAGEGFDAKIASSF